MAFFVCLLLVLVPLLLTIKWFHSIATVIRQLEQQGIPKLRTTQPVNDWKCVLGLNPGSLFLCWTTLSNLKKKIFCFLHGSVVRIIISDPLLLRELLVENSDFYCKPSFVRVLEILGDGLFSSSGDVWFRQRQLLSPYFVTKYIKAKVQAMVDAATSAAKNVTKDCTGDIKEIDIHELFLSLTLNILNRTTFGSAELQENSQNVLKRLSHYHHCRRSLIFGLPGIIPGYRYLLETFHSKDHQYLTSLIAEVIKNHDRTRDRTSPDEPTLLIDVLLEAGDTGLITEEEMLDNCMTLLLAGHETTASLLTWTFYLLGLHPTWQEQARAEVTEFIKSTESITLTTVSHLKTLAAILLETLRLFPPQPLIGRHCIQENMLGSYRIAAGMEVVIPIASMHRNEEFWGVDAAEFNPGRFSNGIKNACSHSLAYLPFGTGPRTCIGQSLALAEAKVVLVIFLSSFSWEISPFYRHFPDVTALTLHPKFGMPVILKQKV